MTYRQDVLIIGGILPNKKSTNQLNRVQFMYDGATGEISSTHLPLPTVWPQSSLSSQLLTSSTTASEDDISEFPKCIWHCNAVSLPNIIGGNVTANAGAAGSANTVIVAGGREPRILPEDKDDTEWGWAEKANQNVWLLDVETGHWQRGPSMINSREGLGLCATGPWLVYAAGGDSTGRTAEFLDIRESKWRRLPRMRCSHRWTRLVAINNSQLLILGGETNVVERFEIGAVRWDLMTELSKSRTYHTACVHNGLVYVLGGLTASCEVFSPDDTSQGTWQPISSMPQQRHSGEVIVHGHRLIMFGGKDVHGAICKDTLVYTVPYDAWQHHALPKPLPVKGDDDDDDNAINKDATPLLSPLTISHFGMAVINSSSS